jgi:hypothetical protein
MVKFYLSDTPLPAEHLAALGTEWREGGYELRTLAKRFFGSRLFFAPEFRGAFIKSPLQFYLGLLQDLRLEVAPIQRFTLNPMRQMGQLLFYPPNVRGWVGGRNWINSATLAARRQLVETLFAPIDERSLNADEQLDLVAAESNGITAFTVEDAALAPLAQLSAPEAAQRLVAGYLAVPVPREFVQNLGQFLVSVACAARPSRCCSRPNTNSASLPRHVPASSVPVSAHHAPRVSALVGSRRRPAGLQPVRAGVFGAVDARRHPGA